MPPAGRLVSSPTCRRAERLQHRANREDSITEEFNDRWERTGQQRPQRLLFRQPRLGDPAEVLRQHLGRLPRRRHDAARIRRSDADPSHLRQRQQRLGDARPACPFPTDPGAAPAAERLHRQQDLRRGRVQDLFTRALRQRQHDLRSSRTSPASTSSSSACVSSGFGNDVRTAERAADDHAALGTAPTPTATARTDARRLRLLHRQPGLVTIGKVNSNNWLLGRRTAGR